MLLEECQVSSRFYVRVWGFLWAWGLTNCSSYDTLAKVTSLGGIYKHLRHKVSEAFISIYKQLILIIKTLLILNNIHLIENVTTNTFIFFNTFF
jgi:hypothetical protein